MIGGSRGGEGTDQSHGVARRWKQVGAPHCRHGVAADRTGEKGYKGMESPRVDDGSLNLLETERTGERPFPQ